MRNRRRARTIGAWLAGVLVLGITLGCTPDLIRGVLFTDAVNQLVNSFGDTADAICACRLNDPGDPGAAAACNSTTQDAVELAVGTCLQNFLDNEPAAEDAIGCAFDVYDAYLACVTSVLCDDAGLDNCADDLDTQLTSCGAVVGLDMCF